MTQSVFNNKEWRGINIYCKSTTNPLIGTMCHNCKWICWIFPLTQIISNSLISICRSQYYIKNQNLNPWPSYQATNNIILTIQGKQIMEILKFWMNLILLLMIPQIILTKRCWRDQLWIKIQMLKNHNHNKHYYKNKVSTTLMIITVI